MIPRLHIIIITLFLLLVTEQKAAAQFYFGKRKTDWTLAEVKEWGENNKRLGWGNKLLYQGSDSVNHHYISRVVDEFVWFKIKRTELTITEEKPYINKRTSTTPLGYYYVYIDSGYKKTADY